MNEQERERSIGVLSYERATHAPLLERYDVRTGDFQPVGDDPEPGRPWRIDPDTGAEIHAIQRSEPHTYLSDYRVGSSYPATVFVFANHGEGEPADHDAIEAFLRENDLWSDGLTPIAAPDADGLRPGFQFRPPERAPYSIDRVRERVADTFGLDDHEVLGNGRGFQAFVG